MREYFSYIKCPIFYDWYDNSPLVPEHKRTLFLWLGNWLHLVFFIVSLSLHVYVFLETPGFIDNSYALLCSGKSSVMGIKSSVTRHNVFS